MRYNGSFLFDGCFTRGMWNGDCIASLGTKHLKRIYKYCVEYGEVKKAEEIQEELIKRKVFKTKFS